MADDSEVLEDIMEKNIIFAHTVDDQEDVAQLFARYDLLSLPVVDHENRLVGIVTVDDIVEVIHREATEDFQKNGRNCPH